MSRRVLAATDFSAASDEALREASTYAPSGAKLAVCHVLPNLGGINTLFPQRNAANAARAAELEARVRTALEQRVEALIAEPVELFLDQGSDYAEIVRRAEAWSADLLVIGGSGQSALPRLHLGGVAELVVRNAHCPVLVVRAPSKEPQKKRVVLVATDLSDPSMPAVGAGADEARRREARLVVMHAIDFASVEVTIEEIILDNIDRSHGDIDDGLRETIDGELRKALEQTKAKGETRVVPGPAAAAILGTADELQADLVVVGTRGRTGLARLALGNVAERVVRAAACSVLAVRLSA